MQYLQQAIKKAQTLSDAEQEKVGAWLLAEIQTQRRWKELISKHLEALERMADEVIQAYQDDLNTKRDNSDDDLV